MKVRPGAVIRGAGVAAACLASSRPRARTSCSRRTQQPGPWADRACRSSSWSQTPTNRGSAARCPSQRPWRPGPSRCWSRQPPCDDVPAGAGRCGPARRDRGGHRLPSRRPGGSPRSGSGLLRRCRVRRRLRSLLGHRGARTPLWTRGSEPIRCRWSWLSRSMEAVSATVMRSRTSIPLACSPGSRTPSGATARSSGRSCGSPTSGACCTRPPPTRVRRPGGCRAPRAVGLRRVPGWRWDTRGRAVRGRGPRRRDGRLHPVRDGPDGRRPRTATPAPPALGEGGGLSGSAVEDPSGRQRHPLPAVRGGPVGRRRARRPGQRVRAADDRALGRAGRRPLRAGGAGRERSGSRRPSAT